MNRTLGALVLVAAGGAACSSSSGASGVSQQLCALASACAGTSSVGFGQLCQLLQSEAALATGFGSDSALFAATLRCVEAASDCASLRACVTVPASASAACTGASASRCSGGYVVECGSTKLGGLTQGTDCAGAGLTCESNAQGAACGSASCDPATTKPACDGDDLVTCESFGGARVRSSCKGSVSTACSSGGPGGSTCRTQVGETCGVVAGTATCVGTGAACDTTTFKNSCNGATLTSCAGGKTSTFDCTTLDPNATCQIASGGEAQCAGAGTQCTDKTPETCAGGVITYCSWGTTMTVDCKAYGLSGCTTSPKTLQSGPTAACTP